jgi:hypothetical protein
MRLYPFMMADDITGGKPEEKPEVKPDEKPEQKPEVKQERSVPEATFLEEKKKRKELERRLREFEEKNVDKDVAIDKANIKKKYVDKGYDEDLAETIAEDMANLRAEFRKSRFSDLDDSTIDDDLKELARDNFFKDASVYKKEISTAISEAKKKGIELSAEDAYFKVRGKTRLKEYQTEIEQLALLKRKETEEKEIPQSSPKSPKDPYPLDEADKKALEGLQKAMPSAGWTPEKYFKLMKG